MTQSSISHIRIPMIVPKRNKGHHEVACDFNLKTSTLTDVTNFVQYFTPLIKNICTIKTVTELASTVLSYSKLDDIDLNMHFLYHLDRASSTYKDSFYEMTCFFNVTGNHDKLVGEMGINIPVRVKDIFVVVGQLTLSIVEPPDIYFEDVLDHLQKFTDTRIYPSVDTDDNKQLPFMVDVGMRPVDYINTLACTETIKKIGKTVKVDLKYPDIYNSYEILYKTTWSSL